MNSSLRRTLRLALPLVLLVVTACARCGVGVQETNAERFIARDAHVVAAIPSPGLFAERARALRDLARATPGGDRFVKVSAELARQLGFDPLTREGLKSAGIDANRPLALGVDLSSSGLRLHAALPIASRDALEGTLTRLVENLAAAPVRESRTVGEVKVTVLLRAPGTPAPFAWAEKNGYLLFASAPDGTAAELAAAAAAREQEASIAAEPRYATARERLGKRELVVYVPRPETATLPFLPEVAALGVGLGPEELGLRAWLAVSAERAASLRAALAGGGVEELKRLPAAAPFYLRGGIDLAKVVEAVERSEEGRRGFAQLRGFFAEAEVDFDKQLANVEPGFALSVGVARTANLSRAFDFNPRRSNPFESYTLVGIGRVKDGGLAREGFDKLVKQGDRFGAEVTARDAHGARIYTARYRLGDGLTWALKDSDLLVTGGAPEKVEEWVGLLGKKDRPSPVQPAEFPPRAREVLFGSAGLAVALDAGKLNESLTALPSSAYGYGPGALMARSAANAIVQPLSRLRGAAGLEALEDGLTIDLSVGAR